MLQKEAEQRRGFDPETPLEDRAKGHTLFFEDLLDAKVRGFKPALPAGGGGLAREVPRS